MGKKLLVFGALAVCMALCLGVLGANSQAVAGSFPDVSPTAWYAAEVRELTRSGVVKGYPDGTFGPEKNVSRGELVTLAARCVDREKGSRNGYWCGETIAWAMGEGRLPYQWGYDQNTIDAAHFEVSATREEAAFVFYRILEPTDKGLGVGWNDIADMNSIDPALQWTVVGCYNAGLLQGDPAGNFLPKSHLTRAQVAVMLYRAGFDALAVTPPTTPPTSTDTPVNTPEPTPAPALGEAAGPLHVEGTHLANENGEVVQLKGVSTHGLAWFPEYVSVDSFRTAQEVFGINAVRLALYTQEYGGYCSGGDKKKLEELVDKGVKAAEELGLYVIIDWHILSDGNPQTHQDEAVKFFAEMSKKYQDKDHVLYELCNEPQNSPWKSVIKPYAEKVLKVIRASDPDAVVIVGTNTWSQDVEDVIGNRIEDKNVVYAFHFYAGTHKDPYRQKVKNAVKAGIPVFVSECGLCDASGGGAVDSTSAKEWFKLLDDNQISFFAWSLCNKNETASLLRSGCKKTSGWTVSDLSDSGKLFREGFLGAGQ